MPTKMARRDYDELLPGYVTSETQINPGPRNMQQRGQGHAALEEKTRGALKNLFIYELQFCLITILMDSQFQNHCSKTAVLIMLLATPCTSGGQ